MREFNKIFAVGLPRCGGQSLQQALHLLTGKNFHHSLGRNFNFLQHHDGGAVEVWQPISWLEEQFPGSLYILNTRDVESWLKSCERVYPMSEYWNNPIWSSPLSAFEHYRNDHEYSIREAFDCSLDFVRWIEHDFVNKPSWEPLCEFLEMDIKSLANDYPNTDKVGRLSSAPRTNVGSGVGYF